jgi:hypothetical protein
MKAPWDSSVEHSMGERPPATPAGGCDSRGASADQRIAAVSAAVVRASRPHITTPIATPGSPIRGQDAPGTASGTLAVQRPRTAGRWRYTSCSAGERPAVYATILRLQDQ